MVLKWCFLAVQLCIHLLGILVCWPFNSNIKNTQEGMIFFSFLPNYTSYIIVFVGTYTELASDNTYLELTPEATYRIAVRIIST